MQISLLNIFLILKNKMNRLVLILLKLKFSRKTSNDKEKILSEKYNYST